MPDKISHFCGAIIAEVVGKVIGRIGIAWVVGYVTCAVLSRYEVDGSRNDKCSAGRNVGIKYRVSALQSTGGYIVGGNGRNRYPISSRNQAGKHIHTRHAAHSGGGSVVHDVVGCGSNQTVRAGPDKLHTYAVETC